MSDTTEMVDPSVERTLVCTLWEETKALGAKRGAQLLSRVQLAPGDFSTPEASKLFAVLTAHVAAGKAPALDGSYPPELREYLDTQEVLSVEPLDAHAERLKALALRRGMKRSVQRIWEAVRAGEMSSTELEALFRSEARSIPQRMNTIRPLSETMREVEQHLRDVADGRKKSSVLTGFPCIDEVTAGLPATLVVIAAMPGVGKSAFEAAIIRNMAMRGERSLTFCLEDRSEWLAFRLLAHESGVHQFLLRHRPLNAGQWERVGESVNSISGFDGNILCDDREALTPGQVLSTARHAFQEMGVRAIFLDNMTAMDFSGDDRKLHSQIQDFLRDARSLANEFSAPFVVLAHAKRREGLDVDKIPSLTDCAESSAYERLARVAYGLARDKATSTLYVGILKNTNGQPYAKFELPIRPTSALVDEELKKEFQQQELLVGVQ